MTSANNPRDGESFRPDPDVPTKKKDGTSCEARPPGMKLEASPPGLAL